MAEPFVGEIRMFAGNFAPRGWAFCDGQLLAITQNEALFSLFGTLYGGDGRTTFGLPDMRGRVPVHSGQGPGLTNRRIGLKAGAETATVNASQLPPHSHDLRGSSNLGSDTSPAGNVPATGAGANLYKVGAAVEVPMDAEAITVTGGGQAHTNLMPFQCVHFIVALSGVYPSRS